MAHTDSDSSTGVRRAGAFDVRNFIGLLIGIYGVVLVLVSIFDNEAEIAKADGVRVNLWAGLGMIVVAVVFGVWARLRPVVVPVDPEAESGADADRAH